MFSAPVMREQPPVRQEIDATASARALGGLVLDTLEMLGAGDVEPNAAASLREWWTRAYEKGERLKDACVTDGHAGREACAVLASAASIHAAGRGSPYPLMLAGPHWRLQIHPWRGTSRFVLNASFLASASPADVRRECERVAWFLYRKSTWKVSRIDVACDCAGLDVARFAQLEECVSRTRCATVHADGEEWSETSAAKLAKRGAQVETVTLGRADSPMQLCIYDKAREAQKSGKAWQLDRARAEGWQQGETLVRVEARFRSTVLDEFPLFDLRDLSTVLDDWQSIAPKLWAYATQTAVRFVVPTSDTNRARWPMRDDWQVVASVGGVAPERCRIVTESSKQERRKRASQAVLRGLVALASEHAHTTALASSMMRKAVDDGQAPEVALAAAVLSSVGELLGLDALGERDALDRSLELRARLKGRRAWVAWADNHAAAFNA
jgi:hypothetical protein